MMDGNLAPPRSGLVSDKIQRRHRERLAAVYIRQSTPQQMVRHKESTRLQYALVERAFNFGWPRSSILVVDDDLGRSGSSIEGRPGFQRLVAEVGLGNIGLVLGVAFPVFLGAQTAALRDPEPHAAARPARPQ